MFWSLNCDNLFPANFFLISWVHIHMTVECLTVKQVKTKEKGGHFCQWKLQ